MMSSSKSHYGIILSTRLLCFSASTEEHTLEVRIQETIEKLDTVAVTNVHYVESEFKIQILREVGTIRGKWRNTSRL
jgi:hypothetical protein